MDDEAKIIEKARKGDKESFSLLLGLYKKAVYNLCLRMLNDRMEAEDAAQESFVKIYRGLKTYNGQSKFSTWSLRIASNVCIDIIRKRKAVMVPIEDYEIKDSSSPEKEYIQFEAKNDIKKAVQKLPEKYRIMIIYYHYMNLSYQEICDMTGEPMTIVKNRLYRARLMLKENLFEKEDVLNGLQENI